MFGASRVAGSVASAVQPRNVCASDTSERELISSTDVTNVLPALLTVEFQNPPSTPCIVICRGVVSA
ncbi:MAG: hypothetical protein U0M82_02390 [Bilophila wadsworthia]|uniref:hypothetical protein n=1 Tax=Bilophila wadsworthia TaxID=35833 RepID=UPI002F9AA06C